MSKQFNDIEELSSYDLLSKRGFIAMTVEAIQTHGLNSVVIKNIFAHKSSSHALFIT